MQKQELIQLHALLAQVRHKLESDGVVPSNSFGEYDNMRITPVHVFRDREAHKEAFFTLAHAIAGALKTTDAPASAVTGERPLARAR